MTRPWKIWLIFAFCAAIVLSVMGWVSATALRLDRSQAQARAQAELEEKVRLALWRMDSMLSPLLAQESVRPYFTYSAFHSAERAYGKMFNSPATSELLIPSPLLTQTSSNILLHFQFDPRGRLTSPQIPEGQQRALSENLISADRLDSAAARLRDFEMLMSQTAVPRFRSAPGASPSNREILFAAAPSLEVSDMYSNFSSVLNTAVQEQLQNAPLKKSRSSLWSQSDRNSEELQARAQSVKQAYDVSQQNVAFANSPRQDRLGVSEGLFKPVWFGNALVLVRQVSVKGEKYIQGCWLDWTALQRWLLNNVADLLPGARLEPIPEFQTEDPQARLLATLPVRLMPGEMNLSSSALASPIRFALLFAWTCILLAGLALALLLGGTLSLSERRAAFVSAVTHELRTPLTTFKMYSEMLASNMVPDKSRREYLSTLCAEANRLNHLVENVLAYARLERGSARARTERLTLRELVTRVKPRLAQRTTQAGLHLQEDFDPRALDQSVEVDPTAVEQILFNLVDNACKYAAPSNEEKIIHLEALFENGNFALLRVRDHGQGISGALAKRLFEPFSKSAEEAAHSAPGVGLGLALSRRLARTLKGDLRLSRSATRGACFELLLPLSAPAAVR